MAQYNWMASIALSKAGMGFVLVLVYIITLAVYRLYLSPLAKFPGPRLAALTLWYEFYYDVVQRGRYTWKIREMHRIYGMRHSGPRAPVRLLIKNLDRAHSPD